MLCKPVTNLRLIVARARALINRFLALSTDRHVRHFAAELSVFFVPLRSSLRCRRDCLPPNQDFNTRRFSLGDARLVETGSRVIVFLSWLSATDNTVGETVIPEFLALRIGTRAHFHLPFAKTPAIRLRFGLWWFLSRLLGRGDAPPVYFHRFKLSLKLSVTA